jgi:hypothetical protein
MTVRPLRSSDIPLLKHYAEVSGFPYPEFDDPHVEAVLVVADSEDRPIIACAAKCLIELYGYFDPSCSPPLRMKALGMMHEGMATVLRDKGYNSAECFVPSGIEKTFGARLMRGIRSPRFLWRWAKNWRSFTIRF